MTRWELTRSALDSILGRLDPDPERAGTLYRALHERLVSIVEWWGARQPHELADRTLDRVAVKLGEGADIPDGALHAYIRSVAWLVFRESLRETEREAQAQREEWIQGQARLRRDEDRELEQMHRTLDHCLDTLPPSDCELILTYYGAEEESTIAIRRKLATSLGISVPTLRVRAHRLRERVQQCVDAASNVLVRNDINDER
ncbi:MAG TPA: hypothetical protein VGQ76_04330 [Thermoanaerobaculia bacterium]|jgi:DNA-directed RNA polymerase specialized sigma24 family protein|nr:hypothetical protein [Thermoanaerobaculia bacterium]